MTHSDAACADAGAADVDAAEADAAEADALDEEADDATAGERADSGIGNPDPDEPGADARWAESTIGESAGSALVR